MYGFVSSETIFVSITSPDKYVRVNPIMHKLPVPQHMERVTLTINCMLHYRRGRNYVADF
jgi:hypothetical protein